MSERSIYLRDQAAKCQRHASAMTDHYTQTELRKLAAEYIVRAAEIEEADAESKDAAFTRNDAEPATPSLAQPTRTARRGPGRRPFRLIR
jgi:hypothetical protein